MQKNLKRKIDEPSPQQPSKKGVFDVENWIKNQLKYNDDKIKAGRVFFPIFQVTSKKRAAIEHDFWTGSTFVLLQQVPSNFDYSKVTGIKMDLLQWAEFTFRVQLLQRFIKALEGTADGTETVDNILQDWPINKAYDQYICRIPMANDIWITLKWSETKCSYYMDIRQGIMKPTNTNQDRWEGTEHGICFGGNSLKLFLDNIVPKVVNATRMWHEMHNAGSHMIESLLSTYKSKGVDVMIDWKRHVPVEDEDDDHSVYNENTKFNDSDCSFHYYSCE